MLCTVLPCQRGVCIGGTTHRLQCQWVGMHGTGWACCVWAAWGVGMYAHTGSASLPQRGVYSARWLGESGEAFSPSVTQEMAISNLCHLGSPSLNCHLLSFTQCRLCPSCSPKGAHFWCPPLSPVGGGVHPAVHAWPDAAGGGFDYTGKKLSHTGSRQMKLQQEGFQLDVKKNAPFGKERKVIS